MVRSSRSPPGDELFDAGQDDGASLLAVQRQERVGLAWGAERSDQPRHQEHPFRFGGEVGESAQRFEGRW
jgi:hypothetical protein